MKKSSQNVEKLEALVAAHKALIAQYREVAAFIGPSFSDGKEVHGQMMHLNETANQLEDLL